MDEKEKRWEEGWYKGFSDGYKKAIENIIYILEKGDIRKLTDKLYRNEWRK